MLGGIAVARLLTDGATPAWVTGLVLSHDGVTGSGPTLPPHYPKPIVDPARRSQPPLDGDTRPPAPKPAKPTAIPTGLAFEPKAFVGGSATLSARVEPATDPLPTFPPGPWANRYSSACVLIGTDAVPLLPIGPPARPPGPPRYTGPAAFGTDGSVFAYSFPPATGSPLRLTTARCIAVLQAATGWTETHGEGGPLDLPCGRFQTQYDILPFGLVATEYDWVRAHSRPLPDTREQAADQTHVAKGRPR